METDRFREKSLSILSGRGIALPVVLPLIDNIRLRTTDEIVDRILCLNVIAASAYGLEKTKAIAWIKQEHLDEKLSTHEVNFLAGEVANTERFKVQVEGMWALAWAINIVERLDFWQECEARFVTMLPNVNMLESSSEFREKALLKTADEVGGAADLAYCLHWCIREAELKNSVLPNGITKYVIEERRKALEWLIGDEIWDAVVLDT